MRGSGAENKETKQGTQVHELSTDYRLCDGISFKIHIHLHKTEEDYISTIGL